MEKLPVMLKVIDGRETVTESWAKDGITFIVLAFLIVISRDSTWWTFFTGLMAVLFVIGKIMSAYINRTSEASTKEEALKIIDEIDWN